MRTNLKEAEIKNRELINQIQQLQSEALNKNGTTDSLGASTNVQLKKSRLEFFTVNLCCFQGLKSNDVVCASDTNKVTFTG